MQLKDVRARVSFEGKSFDFAVNEGLGLVHVNGRVVLLQFYCPDGLQPPGGVAEEFLAEYEVWLINGKLTYKNRPVYLGEESTC
jgi:hypothetical protein